MRVAVVSDSTANLPAEVAAAAGIAVVPMTVVIGGRSLHEGRDVTPAQIAAAMRAGQPVSTAHPGPEAFLERYVELAAAGAQSIVSIHVSSRLSGACSAARLAAADAPVPVDVIDSRTVAMALGFAALAAARCDSADPSVVAAVARDVASGSGVWFFVDDLEFLRRGGRIGAARALVGNALAIKPLLTIAGGEVAAFDRVRTTTKAMARLVDVGLQQAVLSPSTVAVHHADAPERADDVAEALRSRLPGSDIQVSELSAVVAAHTGPGTIAVVVAPSDSS